MRLAELCRSELERIITWEEVDVSAHVRHDTPILHNTLGLISMGPSEWEQCVSAVAASRVGAGLIPFQWPSRPTPSSDEMLRYLDMIGRGIDILLTSVVDMQTFGAGRLFIERLEQYGLPCSVLSLKDDIYNHLLGLAYLSVLNNHLRGLAGRQLVVSWGFGGQFSLPNVAHSIVSLAPTLGANVRIVCPTEFSLLRRVVRVVTGAAKTTGVRVEEQRDRSEGLVDADAVVVFNWCRLDDFNDMARNEEFAREFREWYFQPEDLPAKACLMTEPFVQEDVLASRALLDDRRNITPHIFRQSVKTLCSLIARVMQHESEDRPPVLI